MDSEVTDVIRTVYKVECLNSVIRILMIASDPRFVDREGAGLGLSNSCWEAITSIAKSNYSLTIDTLESYRHSGNDKFDETIGDMIQKIKSNRGFANAFALSFESALFFSE